MEPTAEKTSKHNLLIAEIILILGIVATTGLWFWHSGNRTSQVMVLWVILPATTFFLTLWWTFLSGFRWRTRFIGLGILGMAAGVFFSSFRFVYFSGDFIPQFTFRGNSTAEERAIEYWETVSTDSEVIEISDSQEPLEITDADWSGFRGANRDGIVSDVAINRDWKDNPPRLLWKHPIGKGWSSFAVVDRYAFTQEQRINEECVVCYDIQTGQQIWKHADPGEFSSSQGGRGPMATPTVYDSRVYTVGGAGILNCLEAKTGEWIWVTNILKDADALNLGWGMSGSPLVYDDRVVVNPGGGFGKSVAAYDRLTGEKLWSAGDEPASYSSPSLATIGGVRQILVFHGIGISGYDAQTGKELWKYNEWGNGPGVNAAQPIVRDGKQVFISCGYGKGSALLHVAQTGDRWSVTKDETFNSRYLQMKFSSGVFKDGYVYGLSERILTCVEYATGKQLWRKRGNFGFGQLLLAGDDLLILTEKGEMVLYEAKPNNARELGRFKAIEGITWNHPVLHKGRLLVRNGEEAACYDLNPVTRVVQGD